MTVEEPGQFAESFNDYFKSALIEIIHAVDAEYLLDAVMGENRTDLFYPGHDRYEEIVASRAQSLALTDSATPRHWE
jgi:hypothetical protein